MDDEGGDRYYRGACPHGTWMALLRGELVQRESVDAACPACGPVPMTSREPPPGA